MTLEGELLPRKEPSIGAESVLYLDLGGGYLLYTYIKIYWAAMLFTHFHRHTHKHKILQ